jgi:hypothetical protein
MDELKTPEGIDPRQLVSVAKFMDPTEAQMAKGLLESASLECFLQGENANNLLGVAFRARLLVYRKDEAAARELLAGGNTSGMELEAPDGGE